MSNESSFLIGILVMSAVVITIIIAIMRAVFSIPTIVINLKEQTRLLAQIEANTRPKTD
jgi:hypothetical protein